MNQNEEKEPYTWAKLKDFCNSLTDFQLQHKVCVIREDDSLSILEAAEIGTDMYKFDDEEYSVSKEDFDPEYHCEGKYKSFDEAIDNEDYVLVPANRVFLFEDF